VAARSELVFLAVARVSSRPAPGSTLNALSTYLIVVGTVAILTRFVDVAFPVRLFAGVYALIAPLQFRDVYGELCRKMEKC